MTMRMRLLMRHIKTVTLEVQVVDVGNPRPRSRTLWRHTLSSIPHGLLPICIRRLDLGLRERSIEIIVGHIALVAAVIAPTGRVVQLVNLDGRIRAPAPQNRLRKLHEVQLIPAAAMYLDLKPNLGKRFDTSCAIA